VHVAIANEHREHQSPKGLVGTGFAGFGSQDGAESFRLQLEKLRRDLASEQDDESFIVETTKM
jgi:hypothetical protein